MSNYSAKVSKNVILISLLAQLEHVLNYFHAIGEKKTNKYLLLANSHEILLIVKEQFNTVFTLKWSYIRA